MKNRVINLPGLARVGGEGGLYLKLRSGRAPVAEFRVHEPPRFFEALVRGRKYDELPDIVARITSLSSVTCALGACLALEDAFGVTVTGPLRELRRLICFGEWIQNHALHIYMLHAPDFLGYRDAIQMSRELPEVFVRGLKLKRVGADLVELIGGRAMHPVNIRVGGFYKAPSRSDLVPMTERLLWAGDALRETVRWVAKFEYPAFEREHEYVALCPPAGYPLFEGRILSSKGLDIRLRDYDRHFLEQHLPYSNALHSFLKDSGTFCVGPQARYNLAFDRLAPAAREAAREAGLGPVVRNPFQSIIVRAIEALHACEEARQIIAAYEPPETPSVPVQPVGGTGCGCAEAPHGILYHRYRVDSKGIIRDAKIVPPSTQNQKVIEEDLRHFVPSREDLPPVALARLCEQAVRNYAPCLSCATH